MPSCEKHVDGFASRSRIPYSEWRRKRREEVRAFEQYVTQSPDTTPSAASDSLRGECDELLNYISDDIRPPDPRFATPQGTWNVLIQALTSGDKATIGECFAAGDRTEYMSVIDQMTPEQLARIGSSFSGFQVMEPLSEDLQEALVTKGELAGIAVFVNTGRGWLVSQMP
jgi:hypothetical protein